MSEASTKLFDAVIVGGGIAGMATASGLIRRGITDVLVLEKATKMRPVGASLAIFSNGLKALEYLSPSVAEKVLSSSIPIESMVLKDQEGAVVRESPPPASVNYVVWYLLQQYLAEDLPGESVRLGYEVLEAEEEDGVVTIKARDCRAGAAKDIISIRSRVFIGADGIHSPTRERLFGNVVEKHSHGKIMYRTVLSKDLVENPPPTGTNVSFQGDEAGKVFHYRETAKGILTVTSMARTDDGSNPQLNPEKNLSPEQRKEHFFNLFLGYPTEVQNILENVPPEAVYANTIQDIDVVDKWSKGRTVLVGDSAHAMSPSLGQGANQSLEDACVLVHMLVPKLLLCKSTDSDDKHGSDLPSILEKFWSSRIERVKQIHAASRARSMRNNHSTKSKPIDMTSTELKNILDEIDNWDAPVDEP